MEVTGDRELVVWNKDHQAQVMKGKRTKRSRLPSPLRLSMASSSSSACGRTSTDDNSGGSSSVVDMATATTTSTDQLRASTEEEDMANCLILLAQGHTREEPSSNNNDKAPSSGLYVYQCKTCDRCFPSFQALGGHRASHKKTKPNNSEEKLQPSVTFANEEAHHDAYDPNGTSFVLSLRTSNSSNSNTNNKPKLHECSFCGAEFTSGQALGGHMRRHRTLLNNSATTTTTCTTSMGNNSQHQHTNKPTTKNVLKLDLNLPAPEDDHRESKLPFQSKENVLVFSASSLVDCHY